MGEFLQGLQFRDIYIKRKIGYNKVMIKTKTKRIATVGVGLMFLFSCVFGLIIDNDAKGLSRACRSSAACREAAAKEEEANKNAESAAKSANAYQNKVNETAAEIAGKEVEILKKEKYAKIQDEASGKDTASFLL